MKEHFDDVKAGDVLSAEQYNRIMHAVESLDAVGPPSGQNGLNIGGVSGQTQTRLSFKMVRIESITVPQSSSLWDDSLTYRADGANGYNAVIQVWDDVALEWTDNADDEKIEVIIQDDQEGWRPLTVGDIIPVEWSKQAAAWVPHTNREVAVVIFTGGGADADGHYAGQRVVYVSETRLWTVAEDVYLADLG